MFSSVLFDLIFPGWLNTRNGSFLFNGNPTLIIYKWSKYDLLGLFQNFIWCLLFCVEYHCDYCGLIMYFSIWKMFCHAKPPTGIISKAAPRVFLQRTAPLAWDRTRWDFKERSVDDTAMCPKPLSGHACADRTLAHSTQLFSSHTILYVVSGLNLGHTIISMHLERITFLMFLTDNLENFISAWSALGPDHSRI